MESVQRVDAVVEGVVIWVLGFDFLWLLDLLWLHFVGLALLALNDLASALGLFFPSLLLGQVDILSISLSLLFSSLVILSIGSDVFAVLDHEFAQFDGLPVGVSVNKGLSFGLEFEFSFLITFLSFLFLLDSFLSSFLSFFELFLLFGLLFGLFLLSSFVLLFALSLVVDFFLDILDVSQQIFLIFPLIKLFIVLGPELIHFFIDLISFSLSILDFLIILGLDVLNGSDFGDNTFFLLALLLQFGDLVLEWLKLFIVSVDFLF